MHAIDRGLLSALEDLLDQLDADGGARVLILIGAGRAFCAGADLKSDFVASTGPADSLTSQLRLSQIVERLYGLRQPVIALEARTQLLCGQSGDFKEAVSAFLEKRPADFSRSQ